MAKGLNLTDTRIRELYICVVDDASGNPVDARIKTLVAIMDENGKLVSHETSEEMFSTISNQRKAALNNYFRLSSQKENQDRVNESSISWVDL